MAAKKGNQNALGNEGGRPTKYDPSYNDSVYKLCLLGATDKQIADFFSIAVSTLNLWKLNEVEFSESLKRGKIAADMDVAASLYDTTKDRIVIEKKAFKVKKVFWEDGKRHESETIELADEERVIPADYRSQSLWLRNRHSTAWKDKQEIDHTTNGKDMPVQLPVINIVQPVEPKDE